MCYCKVKVLSYTVPVVFSEDMGEGVLGDILEFTIVSLEGSKESVEQVNLKYGGNGDEVRNAL
jgi:hypothetical protein